MKKNRKENGKYKQFVENISNNLYEYLPDKTTGIAEATLARLESAGEDEKVVLLCSKMIQGCLASGNYLHALELTHKILSRIQSSSIDPSAPDFNKYFFLMTLIHVEILFNIGAWEDCIDIGYKVLSVVNQNNLDKLRPDYLSKDSLKNYY